MIAHNDVQREAVEIVAIDGQASASSTCAM